MDPIPNPLSYIGGGDLAPDPLSPVEYHTHNGIDSPFIDNSGSGNPFISGKALTTGEEAISVKIKSLHAGSALAVAYVTARDANDGLNSSFVRTVAIKNESGTLEFFDQVQDGFTMREQNCDVDYNVENANLLLRFWGLDSQTIQWRYSVLIFPM